MTYSEVSILPASGAGRIDIVAYDRAGVGLTMVSAYYDRIARIYDVLWRRYVRRTASIVARHARPQDGDAILDVGCGTGVLLDRLHRQCRPSRLVGFDASHGMLARAAERIPEAELICGDAHALPFGTGAFDRVIASSMLQHVDDPETVVRELCRVLRPEGRLVILAWREGSRFNRSYRATLGRLDPSFVDVIAAEELDKMLSANGVRVDHLETKRAGWWGLVLVVATGMTRGTTSSA